MLVALKLLILLWKQHIFFVISKMGVTFELQNTWRVLYNGVEFVPLPLQNLYM